MHVTHLSIDNLRSLAHAQVELNHPGQEGSLAYPNVNVVLGPNGFGKTSVLRALALSVLGPVLSASSGFVPDGLIRRVPQKAAKIRQAAIAAKVVLSNEKLPRYAAEVPTRQALTMRTRIELLGGAERLAWKMTPAKHAKAIEELQHDDAANAFFMVGYGATRRVEASTRVDESARVKSRRRRYERVASLFEDHLGLMPLSYWLPEFAQRNKGRYAQVVRLINALLPPACRMQAQASDTPSGTEHLFEMNGVTLPFRALSDGYRAYLGWIGDMLFHLCMGAPSGARLVETRGVVLVDEIDLHLHPEWQRVVLPTLSRALPNVQFVVTTHSPLVVGSLEAANLFVLAEEEGATVIRKLPERVHGRSAEQILLSPYFGLESTRAPDVAQSLQALSRAAVSGDAEASLEYLRLLSGGMSAAGVKALPASGVGARKAPAKKSAAAKAAAKKAVAKKAAAKTAVAKKATLKGLAVKKTAAKKTTVKKGAAKAVTSKAAVPEAPAENAPDWRPASEAE